MQSVPNPGRWFRHSVLLAGLFAAAAALTNSPAQAGSCPADKMARGVRKPVSVGSVGESVRVLASVDLAKEFKGGAGRLLRMRYLEIQPGGTVGWHFHGDRPALIYILDGTIIEYASNCSVPIVHRTGEVSREADKLSHWWKNETNKVVRLLAADVYHVGP